MRRRGGEKSGKGTTLPSAALTSLEQKAESIDYRESTLFSFPFLSRSRQAGQVLRRCSEYGLSPPFPPRPGASALRLPDFPCCSKTLIIIGTPIMKISTVVFSEEELQGAVAHSAIEKSMNETRVLQQQQQHSSMCSRCPGVRRARCSCQEFIV